MFLANLRVLTKGIFSPADFLAPLTGVGEQTREVFGLNMTSDISDGLVPEHTTKTAHLLYPISHYKSIKIFDALKFRA